MRYWLAPSIDVPCTPMSIDKLPRSFIFLLRRMELFYATIIIRICTLHKTYVCIKIYKNQS